MCYAQSTIAVMVDGVVMGDGGCTENSDTKLCL